MYAYNYRLSENMGQFVFGELVFEYTFVTIKAPHKIID